MQDADWFLNANENSFFIMDNLRYMLYPFPKHFPLYFPVKVKSIMENSQVSHKYVRIVFTNLIKI